MLNDKRSRVVGSIVIHQMRHQRAFSKSGRPGEDKAIFDCRLPIDELFELPQILRVGDVGARATGGERPLCTTFEFQCARRFTLRVVSVNSAPQIFFQPGS